MLVEGEVKVESLWGQRKMTAENREASPLRVAIIIGDLGFGGAERQVAQIANNMDPSKFDVHIICLSDYVPLANSVDRRARNFHIVKRYFRYDLSTVWRLANKLRELDIDLAHAFLFEAEIVLTLASKLYKKSIVVISERNADYRLRKAALFARRWASANADHVIANSNAGAVFHQNMTSLANQKYSVVRNGVDTEYFRPGDKKVSKQNLGISEGKFVVGMFASFKVQKNHRVMFEAVAALKKTGSTFEFLFSGDQLVSGVESRSKYKVELMHLVEQLNIGDVCRFLGNRDDLPTVYSACDVTVLPSIHEGTPNTALESMACGVPVIVTDVADNSSIIQDGKSGFLVPVNSVSHIVNRIQMLRKDPELLMALGKGAMHTIFERYSIRAMTIELADVYTSLCDRRAGHSPGLDNVQ